MNTANPNNPLPHFRQIQVTLACNMRSVIFLACIFMPYIQTEHHHDDPAATDEKNFGKDVYCHFAFGGATDPHHMRLVNSPNAEVYGMGFLANHRLDFAWIPELKLADITIVPDETENVWGTAYLVPLDEYDDIRKAIDTFRGLKYNHSVQTTIRVEIDGEPLHVRCNAFPTIRQPPPKELGLLNDQRPTKRELDFFIKCFEAAKLPDDYIDRVSGIPTKRYEEASGLLLSSGSVHI